MATKKTTPAKKQLKPAAKAAVKAAPSKKAPVKKVAVKATPASKKKTPVKTAAAKAAPKPARQAGGKAAPKKSVKIAAPARSVAKPAPVKKTTAKAVPPKKEAPANTAQAAVAKKPAEKKPAVKAASKKAQPSKPPVVPRLSTKSSVKYQPDFTKSILDTPKNEQVKAVVRYSDSDLQEFKEIILRKLDAAKKELNYLQGLITRRDEGGDMDEGRYMTMEDGSVSMEREQLSQLASRQITFIDHLEKALMRVENKTYGICRVTGNLIDKARLRAVPHATLSIEAKSMMNK